MPRLYSIPLLLMLAVSSVSFAESDNVIKDKFNLRAGTFVIGEMETELRYDTDKIIGSSINSSRDLGMDDSQQTLRIDGYYRFNTRHSIDYSWYHIGLDGNKTLDEDITWEDETYVANAKLHTEYDTDIYKISYAWSFHHDEKVELALLTGLHISRISLLFEGEACADAAEKCSGDSPQTHFERNSVSVTAPLPVVGFKLNYNIFPQLFWRNKVELFYLRLDGIDGNFLDLTSTIEYRPFQHVGFGAGINSINLHVELEDEENLLQLDKNTIGSMIYMSFYF